MAARVGVLGEAVQPSWLVGVGMRCNRKLKLARWFGGRRDYSEGGCTTVRRSLTFIRSAISSKDAPFTG